VPASPRSQLAGGTARDAALNSGYHLAYVIGACLVIGALVISLVVVRWDPAAAMAKHAAAEGAVEPDRAFEAA
jgi:hypothetical protein